MHPFTLDLLRKLNFDVSGLRSKSWSEFARPDAPQLDFVFTVCDDAAKEACPLWPGQPMTAHWGIPDPAAVEGTEVEQRLAFADALRMLTNRINIFVSLPMRSLERARAAEAARRDRQIERRKQQPGFGGVMSEVPASLSRRLIAEGLGTAILVATVVGSGIMAERLAGGNQAIALLGNTIPTGAILVVIITILGPISGAHFNPVVTLVFAARGTTPWREVIPYIVVQCACGIAGTAIAHLMFDLAPLAIGTTGRSGPRSGWPKPWRRSPWSLQSSVGCATRRKPFPGS